MLSLNNYAKSLLEVFVKKAAILFGKSFVCYNIHNLIHLEGDVTRFGPLHTFSAYPFENKLGQIKRLLRKSEKPLQQIVKRLGDPMRPVGQKQSPLRPVHPQPLHPRRSHTATASRQRSAQPTLWSADGIYKYS